MQYRMNQKKPCLTTTCAVGAVGLSSYCHAKNIAIIACLFDGLDIGTHLVMTTDLADKPALLIILP